MSEIINRKLAEAKANIEKIHSNINKEPRQERTTQNACPPIPEAPDNVGVNETDVPGVITGGPKRSNNFKLV